MDNKNWEYYYKILENNYLECGHIFLYDENIFNTDYKHWYQEQVILKNKGKLEETKINALNNIGFIWNYNDYLWYRFYSLAQEYYKENNHLEIPRRYSYNGINLGNWLMTQRLLIKEGKLNDERLAKLNELNFTLSPKKEAFERGYRVALKYYNEYGNLNVNYNVVYDEFSLGDWITHQRFLYNKGQLNIKKIQLLNQLKMSWSPLEDNWNKYYSVAKKYYELYGDLNISENFIFEGLELGAWLRSKRRLKKLLSEKQKNALNDIGMVWNLNEYRWNLYYNEAKKYYEKHHTLEMSIDYMVNGLNIHMWLSNQQLRDKNNKLSEERKILLSKIGFYEKTRKLKWIERYNEAKAYKDEHGHLITPKNYMVNNRNLNLWLNKQRQLRYLGKLSEEQITLLNEIDYNFEKKYVTKEALEKFKKQKEYLENILFDMLNGYDQNQTFNSSSDLKSINDDFKYLLK